MNEKTDTFLHKEREAGKDPVLIPHEKGHEVEQEHEVVTVVAPQAVEVVAMNLKERGGNSEI